MPRLSVPSLQHLARNWRSDPHVIKRTLVGLAKHPPSFSYGPLTAAARDLLAFHQPYAEVAEGISRAIKRDDVRKNFLEVLPLIDGYFKTVTPYAVQTVEAQIYRIGTRLRVPFHPPFVYEVDGSLHLPWLSFWRSNPLAGVNLSLFATMIDDIQRVTPALRGAFVSVLDFSCPKAHAPRELKVIELGKIPRIPNAEKLEMLAIFAEGFFMAQQELSGADAGTETRKDDRRPRGDESRDDLFRDS